MCVSIIYYLTVFRLFGLNISSSSSSYRLFNTLESESFNFKPLLLFYLIFSEDKFNELEIYCFIGVQKIFDFYPS